MRNPLRSKLTFANVMVVLLTFIVLGGGAYAASQLPKNSVGTRQLKKGAVTKAKIKKSTLRELQGAQGPAGPAGAAGMSNGTVPAGVTLRGVAAIGSLSTATGNEGLFVGISFGAQLPQRPVANLVPAAAPPTAACPGSTSAPEAAPGNLCVYINASAPSSDGVIGIVDPTTAGASGIIYNLESKELKSIGGESRVAKFGFQFSFSQSSTTTPQLIGSWAATG